jgi:hypothetical protein
VIEPAISAGSLETVKVARADFAAPLAIHDGGCPQVPRPSEHFAWLKD